MLTFIESWRDLWVLLGCMPSFFVFFYLLILEGGWRSQNGDHKSSKKPKGKKQTWDIRKSSKKLKGNKELLNLTSSINYDKLGGEKKKGEKIIIEVGFLEYSWYEFCL